MFEATIDNKPKTMDPNGNEIVDLTAPIFRNNEKITSYRLRRVPSDFAMRPDLEAFVELGSIDHTEYIMMFNAVGNPFSIDKDDVLLIPNLIEAYNNYKDKGLIVLGVATWDDPADTEKAIKELGIPYPQIMNAQYAGSDAYGIEGIPEIILFAPDGTIVARGLRGEAIEKILSEIYE